MQFEEYAKVWIDSRRGRQRAATIYTFESQLRQHLNPKFGNHQLKAITRDEVKLWAATVMSKMQPTTARQVVFTLASIMREAVDDGRIARNPADRIRVGSKTERRVDPLHISKISAKVPPSRRRCPRAGAPGCC